MVGLRRPNVTEDERFGEARGDELPAELQIARGIDGVGLVKDLARDLLVLQSRVRWGDERKLRA